MESATTKLQNAKTILVHVAELFASATIFSLKNTLEPFMCIMKITTDSTQQPDLMPTRIVQRDPQGLSIHNAAVQMTVPISCTMPSTRIAAQTVPSNHKDYARMSLL